MTYTATAQDFTLNTEIFVRGAYNVETGQRHADAVTGNWFVVERAGDEIGIAKAPFVEADYYVNANRALSLR